MAAPVDTAAVDYVLTTTRAVRRRLDLERAVEPEILLECITLAMQAPVGAGREGPRWIIVTDREPKLQIAEIYREVGRDLLREGAETAEEDNVRKVMESALYLADILEDVPVLVIACAQGFWDTHTHVDTASSFGSVMPAVWSLQLALRSRGLGSTLTTLHLHAHERVAEVLGLPDDVTQVALLPVAYTIGTEFKQAPRPPVEEVTHWNRWGTAQPVA
jgi:nitroreductase